jgi:hypothetical protein
MSKTFANMVGHMAHDPVFDSARNSGGHVKPSRTGRWSMVALPECLPTR